MVRFARQEDLERVNELRKEVNELHVSGRPDIFKDCVLCSEMVQFS